jgi:hypothetical protein
MASRQPDLFLDAPQRDEAPLVGLRIELTRTRDVPCAECGTTVVVVGLGVGPHGASLHCAGCRRHRGWLPKSVVEFLTESIRRFGWPTDPIMIANPGVFAATLEPTPMKPS